MSEIKLTKRFPESRPEDITEAYMRGYEDGRKVSETCEVVCCRDCAEADGESDPGNLHCMVNEWRRVEPDDYCSWGELEPDDYCSWGERRER